MTGKLIIINGGASTGKTTTCTLLQDLLPTPSIRLGVDRFWLAMPPKGLGINNEAPEYCGTESFSKDGRPYFKFVPGPILDKIMCAGYSAMTKFLEADIDIVSDQVFWKPEWVLSAMTNFKPYKTYLVGLFVSDEEGERREKSRGNDSDDLDAGWRPDGLNRASAAACHQHIDYDIKVDNTNLTPEETAQTIYKKIDEIKNPDAIFKTLEALKKLNL